MISIDIPGTGLLELANIVFDYNGTLAADGKITSDIRDRLSTLADSLEIHILTADTFGTVNKEIHDPRINVTIIESGCQAEQKRDYVKSLGTDRTAAVGNGANDLLMLKEAVLGICVIGKEGAHSGSIGASDITVMSPSDAIDLFLNPDRIKATMRK